MARRRSAPAPRRAAPARPQQQTQPAVAPQNAVQAQQPIVVQKGPGMLSNIASTAMGVGIGHAVGHALTGAMSGGSSSQPQEQQQVAPQQYGQQQQQQYNQNPCQLEMENFFNCTQTQFDLSMCENLNAALKECRMRYTNPM